MWQKLLTVKAKFIKNNKFNNTKLIKKGGDTMAEEKIITIKDVDYIVSSDGRVYSTNNNGPSWYHKEISQRKNSDGYMQITVGKTDNRSQYRVHRMVAEAFIPNPDNLPEVNHKNLIRDDNRVENLEWSTHVDNVQYSANVGNYSHYGEDNPNFGNNTLKEKYKNNPELALEKQSRPGSRNGRARAIKLVDDITGDKINFDYIGLASIYLIQNGFTNAKHIDSLSARLSACAQSGNKYRNRFYVEFID